MIALLKGMLETRAEQTCIVDVNGVGYEVYMPSSDLDRLPAPGEPVQVHIWHLQREDGVFLYGFLSAESRQLFKLLLGVTGVGPKAALAVLSALSREQLEHVVTEQDAAALARLPGIGRKTAERLLLELKDKLKLTAVAASRAPGRGGEDAALVLEALAALGYAPAQARRALQQAAEDGLPPARGGEDRVAAWVRQALKHL